MTADVARAANARQVQLEASLSSLLEIADRRGCASLEHARAVAVLRALGRHGEAAALLEQLGEMRTGTPEDCEALGFAAFDAGAHQASRDWYAMVVEARPQDALAWYNLATGERNIGRLDAAEAACDRALSVAPGMAQAALLRSQVRPQSAARNHVDELRAMLDRAASDVGTQIFLHYALGKEFDDLGEYDAAFDQFERGARARRGALAYEVGLDLAKLRRIAEAFAAPRLSQAPPLAAPAYGFILGLPRSGTTLVERILTGSPLARSNGETENLLGALSAAAATEGDVFDRIAQADPAKAQEAYARLAGAPGPVILEKLPLNYLYAGAIRLTMPNARIVRLTRAPADNGLAMFSTLFGSGYPFSYDLEELADYQIAYEQLMAHWRATLGDQWLETAYEAVVDDPVSEGRRAAEHMGVAWTDAMVRIERNASASATASAAQVRRPIYRTAAGRWRNYERHLGAFLRRLEAAGIDPAA